MRRFPIVGKIASQARFSLRQDRFTGMIISEQDIFLRKIISQTGSRSSHEQDCLVGMIISQRLLLGKISHEPNSSRARSSHEQDCLVGMIISQRLLLGKISHEPNPSRPRLSHMRDPCMGKLSQEQNPLVSKILSRARYLHAQDSLIARNKISMDSKIISQAILLHMSQTITQAKLPHK